MGLTILLYRDGYPPEWDEEVFEKVMEQAENFKKYNPDGDEPAVVKEKNILYRYDTRNFEMPTSMVAEDTVPYGKKDE